MLPLARSSPVRRRVAAPGGGGGFTDPTTITGLALWLKADAGTYDALSDGSPVTADGGEVWRWEDQSAAAGTAPSLFSGSRPILRTSQVNGRPAIEFGTGHFGAATLANITGTGLTAFAVFNWGTADSYERVLSLTSGASNDYDNTASCVPINRDSTTTSLTATRNFPATLSNTTLANSTWAIASSKFDGTNHRIYLNGSGATAQPCTGSFGITHYQVGYLLTGHVAEVLLYDSALSDADRANVESYLNDRYAIY